MLLDATRVSLQPVRLILPYPALFCLALPCPSCPPPLPCQVEVEAEAEALCLNFGPVAGAGCPSIFCFLFVWFGVVGLAVCVGVSGCRVIGLLDCWSVAVLECWIVDMVG
ncbi:uncharacterized protein J3D65DRAFT_619323 [Phyllosticta citribraziliensis]|uniref:Uncharacterized protein n=1 Tax=Phyllosticta citribraziliensis TaxID=989973 RepID=A0ABR1M0T2_9PEZI